MNNTNFYASMGYKERQSEVAKKSWQTGAYDSLYRREERKCINPDCKKVFEVNQANPKKFCSRKCAAQINNLKRSNISPKTRVKIASLYRKGLSMQEIADKMGWSIHKSSYWLDKDNIPRRSRSEAAYVKWNPGGDPFKIKNRLNTRELLLKGLGLGLYWGEGDKGKNNTSVRLSNTDPQLIKKFKEFLIKICRVKKRKFSYSLILFNDSNERVAVNFWIRWLGIKKTQLGKIVKIPPQGKGTYKKKSQFGVLTINVTNKRLKEQIFQMIQMV